MDLKTRQDKLKNLSPEKRTLLIKALQENIKKSNKVNTIIKIPPNKVPVLSFAQERMWFLSNLLEENPAYNITNVFNITGNLDIEILKKSFKLIIKRHESLRTTFPTIDGKPSIKIDNEGELLFTQLSFEDCSEVDQEKLIKKSLQKESEKSFSLENGPLFRVLLIKLDEVRYIISISIHHIICDGWSIGIIIRELASCYHALTEGTNPNFEELSIQYSDYAYWQKKNIDENQYKKFISDRKQKFEGHSFVLELPSDRPRPPIQSYKGAINRFSISSEISNALRNIGRKEDATLFMVLMAAYNTMLFRYSSQDDIIVGSPIANRINKETENLVGCFMNTIPIRTDLSGNPKFIELLKRTKENILDTFNYQSIPYDRLVDELKIDRDLSRQPLCQVMFVLQNNPMKEIHIEGLTFKHAVVDNKSSKFDLTLELYDNEESLYGWFEYNTDIFDENTIKRMAENFKSMLEDIAKNPEKRIGELEILSFKQKNLLLNEFNKTYKNYSNNLCLHELFELQVKNTPYADAVIFEDVILTYNELNQRANRLSHYLRFLGIGPEKLVGVCMERSIEMVVSLLGILKAGGAYVPIDPEYPSDRIDYMIENSQVSILLTQQAIIEKLSFKNVKVICVDTDKEIIEYQDQDENLIDLCNMENIAYMIYTSGSTGKPKGVMNTHLAICNRLLWMQEQYKLESSDRILQKTPFSFDVSIWEFFWPLITGACLIVARPEGHKDSEYIIDIIEKRKITTVHFVPSMLQAFIESKNLNKCRTLKRVICSGEALTYDLKEKFFKKMNAKLYNLYGPTEAAIDVTSWDCSSDIEKKIVPIGRPISNIKIYILDKRMKLLPIGVPGELHIGGMGLARGYWRLPELTAEKFIADPFNTSLNQKIYKTGDLARFLPDGNIEFLGRIDHQVKIRGFRIELEEIESVLSKHHAVDKSIVVAMEDEGIKRIIAYIVLIEGEKIDDLSLRNYLKSALPEYMIPSIFISIDKLPLSPNGKLDRRMLPVPDKVRVESRNDFFRPQTANEKVLAKIWSEVLRLDKIGVSDDFFELGGDSILSIQVIARAAKQGIHFTPKQMFEYRTISEILKISNYENITEVQHQSIIGTIPLTPVQKWFFEQEIDEQHYFNQSMLFSLQDDIREDLLESVMNCIFMHHDSLRLKFFKVGDDWKQEITPHNFDLKLESIDLSDVPEERFKERLELESTRVQASINLSEGCLIRCAFIKTGNNRKNVFLIVVHHLAIDGVSWHILMEDINDLYNQYKSNINPILPQKTTSFGKWAYNLKEFAQSNALKEETKYWLDNISGEVALLPVDYNNKEELNTIRNSDTVIGSLDKEETQRLLKIIPENNNISVKDILLTALVLTFKEWIKEGKLLIDIENHGREDIFKYVDLTRTIGWFTSIFPVSFNLNQILDDKKETIKLVKNVVNCVPNNGIGFGLLKYMSNDNNIKNDFKKFKDSEVLFNYLGRVDQIDYMSMLSISNEFIGSMRSLNGKRKYMMEVNSIILDEKLTIEFTYSSSSYNKVTITTLVEKYMNNLRSLISICSSINKSIYTPSDFKLASVSQAELDIITKEYTDIEDIYTLSSMQNNVLTYNLLNRKNSIQHLTWNLEGNLNISEFKRAWQSIIERHKILRTSFIWRKLKNPIQIVHKDVKIPFNEEDWSNRLPSVKQHDIEEYIRYKLNEPFKLNEIPLMRLSLIKASQKSFWFIWSYSNSLFDNWSWSVILDELFKYYNAYCENKEPLLEKTSSYSEYIEWLKIQKVSEAEEFWRNELKGYNSSDFLKINKNPSSILNKQGLEKEYLKFTKDQTSKVTEFCRKRGVTLSTLVQGVWCLMIGHLNQEKDILYGLLTSGRPGGLKNVENMVGVFINTLPVRTKICDHMDILSWLRNLQDKLLNVAQYEYISIEEISKWSKIPLNTIQSAIFERTLVYVTSPEKDIFTSKLSNSKEIKVKSFENSLQFNVPLRIYITPGDQLTVEIKYNNSCFDEYEIGNILENIFNLLNKIVNEPNNTCLNITKVII